MANILIYDIDTGKIKQYNRSVNTPSYDGRDDVLVNPDVSLLETVEKKYLLVDAGAIREMTQAEKDTYDAAVVAAKLASDTASVNAFEVSVKDLGKALVALGVVTGSALKTQIKTDKGLK